MKIVATNSLFFIIFLIFFLINQNDGKILTKIQAEDENPKLPLSSVIVTFSSGHSYDPLFKNVKQKAQGRVVIYEANLDKLEKLLEAFKYSRFPKYNHPFENTFKELLDDISQVEPHSVAINFECCSKLVHKFPNTQKTNELIKYFLDRSFMLMFSDFSVKSLIRNWDEGLFGSNPFVITGDCADSMNLHFKKEDLINSPSSQLQMLGELSISEDVQLHLLPGTIIFTIDQNKIDKESYHLNLLTLASDYKSEKIEQRAPPIEFHGKTGTIGHVMLRFSSGGIMLLSAGHWIELKNINVDRDSLKKASQSYYGENNEYLNEIESISSSNLLSNSEKRQRFQDLAIQFIQQSSPSRYTKTKLNIKNEL